MIVISICVTSFVRSLENSRSTEGMFSRSVVIRFSLKCYLAPFSEEGKLHNMKDTIL